MEKWKVFYIFLVAEGFVIGLVADLCWGGRSAVLGAVFVWGILLLSEYRNNKEELAKKRKEFEESIRFLEREP